MGVEREEMCVMRGGWVWVGDKTHGFDVCRLCCLFLVGDNLPAIYPFLSFFFQLAFHLTETVTSQVFYLSV